MHEICYVKKKGLPNTWFAFHREYEEKSEIEEKLRDVHVSYTYTWKCLAKIFLLVSLLSTLFVVWMEATLLTSFGQCYLIRALYGRCLMM